MGDDCNVTIRRTENSSPSSSPELGPPRTKNLDDCRIREIPMEERESLLRSRPESGEPGEGLHRITNDKRNVDHDLLENETDDSKSPLMTSPGDHKTTVAAGFPFTETKLRPDAPPFTPESLARSDPSPRERVEIDDSVCGEPSFVGRSEIDDSCFVNVDLRSNVDETAIQIISPKPKQRATSNSQNSSNKDSRDHVKDPGLKPFSLTSTPRLKRSPPKIDLSVDSVHDEIEMTEDVAVATEAGANDPDIRDNGPEIGEPRVVRRHWRIMQTAFIIGNRIQIAVFIASVVLCVVIVVYVFV